MWSKRIHHLHVLLLAFVLLFSSIPAAAPVLYAQEGEPDAAAEDALPGAISGADQDTVVVYLPIIGNLLPAGQPTPTPTSSGTPSGQPTATLLPSGTPTRQPTVSSTPIGQPTSTPTATRTPTRQPTPSATPLPTATPNTSATVLIPAGSFTMGCDPAIDPWDCAYWGYPETPYHTVNLTAAYRIDKYEVTNARYAACVTSGGCTAPQSTQARRCDGSGNCEYGEYYGVAAYNNHPVVNVTWHQADTYCRATGGRLPTEAEWERAARGKNDRRVWPWGNTLACSNANVYNDQQGNTCSTYGLKAVGSYPTGASPEGVMDMSGNAWEWVNDWAYRVYTEDPMTNPQGPESGSYRVLRGGSFVYNNWDSRVSFRNFSGPGVLYVDVGFRCVRSP